MYLNYDFTYVLLGIELIKVEDFNDLGTYMDFRLSFSHHTRQIK